jgi:hypothetical protein
MVDSVAFQFIATRDKRRADGVCKAFVRGHHGTVTPLRIDLVPARKSRPGTILIKVRWNVRIVVVTVRAHVVVVAIVTRCNGGNVTFWHRERRIDASLTGLCLVVKSRRSNDCRRPRRLHGRKHVGLLRRKSPRREESPYSDQMDSQWFPHTCDNPS